MAREGQLDVTRPAKPRHCHLCDVGFPLLNGWHIPTQSLGMIPVTRCRRKPKKAARP